uniref:Uncharacterized protein n=1 Tax=viral metagenome TaxID=1070528 RepID=A0A6M3KVP0_9ZZZZ
MTITASSAIKKAKKIAAKTGKPFYVVISRDEKDIPGNDFHVASEFDVDTWFDGCEIIYSTEEI